MAKHLRWLGSGVLGLALVAAGTAAGAGSPGKSDNQFLEDAASGGMMEVELGRIATTHASSPRVKEFGQRMVDDHGRANAELKQLAAREKVTLPDTLKGDHREMVDRLSKLQGPEFDRAYMQAMLKDHEEDVAKFKVQARSAHDRNVKTFAAKTLPVLEKHLVMAKDIGHDTGKATSGAGTGGTDATR